MKPAPVVWLLAVCVVCGIGGLGACSNLTSPPGEDPQELPQLATKGTDRAKPVRKPKPGASVVASGPGYVVERIPPPKNRVEARAILISYDGAKPPAPGVKRTKTEARKLASEVAAKARAKGADFIALVRKHSDDKNAASRGGAIQAFVPEGVNANNPIETNTVKLGVGKVSAPIETNEGFVVIQRTR